MAQNEIKLTLTTDASGAVTGIKSVSGELQNFKKTSENSIKGSNDLLTQLKSNWLAVSAAVAGVMITINKAWNLAEMSSQFEEQKTALNSLASQYNTTADSIIDSVKTASNGLISMADAASVSAKALMMGMNPDQIVEFMKVVEATTNVTGQSVASAFETMTEAAATGRERALKQMGIMVDLQGAYKDYAAGIKKTVEELSEQEKQTAAINAILGKSSEILKQLGDSGDSTNDKMERFKAMLSDFKLIIGDVIIAGFAAASMAIFSFVGLFSSAASGIALGIQKVFELGAKIPLLGNIFDPVARGAKEVADYFSAAADVAFGYGLISYDVISGNENAGKSFENLGADVQDSAGTIQLSKKEIESLVQSIDKIKELGKTNLEFGAEGLKEVFDNLKTGGDSVDELKEQMQEASGAVYEYGKTVDEVYTLQKTAIQEVIKQLAEQGGEQESIQKAVEEYSKTEVERLKTNMSAYETYYNFLKGKMDEAIEKQKTLNDEIDAAKKTLSETAASAVLEIKGSSQTDAEKLSSQMTDALGLEGKEQLNALEQYINNVKSSSLDAAQKVSLIYDAEAIGQGIVTETTTEWQKQETAVENIKTSMDEIKKIIDEYKTEIIILSEEIEKMGTPVALNLNTDAATTALQDFLGLIPEEKTIELNIENGTGGNKQPSGAGTTTTTTPTTSTTTTDVVTTTTDVVATTTTLLDQWAAEKEAAQKNTTSTGFASDWDYVVSNYNALNPDDTIPAYASGTDYVPNTGLALLHQGERVLTASENKTYTNNNKKSFSPNITINSSGGNVNARNLAKQVSKEIQKMQYLM